jgi:hypothetical protein
MVPKVNLMDPRVEPTDAEHEALCCAARDWADARHVLAEERFQAEMRDMLRVSRAAAATK